MNNCVFCNIAHREDVQSERIIFEDTNFIAFLVSHPVIKGHCVVFPKRHANQLKSMPHMGELLENASLWAELLVAALGAKAYVLKMNNNLFKLESDHLHVEHVHMHIIPRYTATDQISGKPIERDAGYFKDILALFN